MKRPATGKILYSAVALNAGWFAGVLGAAWNYPLTGIGIVLALVMLHLAVMVRSPRREILLLLGAGLLGYLLDSLLVLADVVGFVHDAQLLGPTTAWMVALWLNLATGLGLALYWLSGRPLLAAWLGFIGGPLAYWGGAELGAITFPEGIVQGLAFIALEWAIAMPLLVEFNDFLHGWKPEETGT
ncbi:MAG TPA: DUF2878 domain-containing protein [Gammaproteobacteria bacterium]